MSIETYLGNIELESCIMNASGCNCQFINDLKQLDKSTSGAIVSKSCTIDKRIGNTLPRYYHNDYLSINSMGLPNEGYKYYIECSKEINKPYIMSVSSQAIFKQKDIIEEIFRENVSAIEINVSCPNIEGEPQLSYDFKKFEEFLRTIFENRVYYKPIGIKLAPYFDTSHFNTVFDIVNEYKNELTFLTCINGIGNGLYIDIDKDEPIIKPKNGLGGLGGKYSKTRWFIKCKYVFK